MSWSGTATIPKGSSRAQADAAIDGISVTGDDQYPTEREQEVSAAKAAAKTFVLAITPLSDLTLPGLAVTISGHATQNHSGGGDSCQASVTQQTTGGVTPPPSPAPAPIA